MDAPNPHHAMPSWLSAEGGKVRTMSGKPHTPRKLRKDQNIKPEEARMRKKMEAQSKGKSKCSKHYWDLAVRRNPISGERQFFNQCLLCGKKNFSRGGSAMSDRGFFAEDLKMETYCGRCDKRTEISRYPHGAIFCVCGRGKSIIVDGYKLGSANKTPQYIQDFLISKGMRDYRAESKFDELADEIAEQYEKKGKSKEEAEKIGKATAYKVGVAKYGKRGMTNKAKAGMRKRDYGADGGSRYMGSHCMDCGKENSKSNPIEVMAGNARCKGGYGCRPIERPPRYFTDSTGNEIDKREYMIDDNGSIFWNCGCQYDANTKNMTFCRDRAIIPEYQRCLYAESYQVREGFDTCETCGDSPLFVSTQIAGGTYCMDCASRVWSAESPFKSDAFNEGRSAGITMFIPEGDAEDYYSNLDTEYMIFYGLSPEDLAKDIDENSKRYLQFVAGWDDGWNYATLLHEGVLTDDSDNEGDFEDLDYEMAGEWIYKDYPKGMQEYVPSLKELTVETVLSLLFVSALGYNFIWKKR